jgi:hypothetical protein
VISFKLYSKGREIAPYRAGKKVTLASCLQTVGSALRSVI